MPTFFKQPAFRSEDLRRAVAYLPCVFCGVVGHTQAAHIGGLGEGKGGALKVPDSRVAALCSDRLGVVGCHTKFDQRTLLVEGSGDLAYHALGYKLIALTYILLVEHGLLKVLKVGPKSQ